MEQNGEVIFAYTDKDAVEDVVLIELSEYHRVTAPLWDYLEERVTDKLPAGWHVPVMVAAKYPYEDNKDGKIAVLCLSLIAYYGARAKEMYENNENGGVWSAALHDDLTLRPGSKDAKKILWAIPNELGGVTLMFPEDY